MQYLYSNRNDSASGSGIRTVTEIIMYYSSASKHSSAAISKDFKTTKAFQIFTMKIYQNLKDSFQIIVLTVQIESEIGLKMQKGMILSTWTGSKNSSRLLSY